ncbi:FecR domain-containing protein [bacterium]|nr:FecR domain-containing protein [bacterium]
MSENNTENNSVQPANEAVFLGASDNEGSKDAAKSSAAGESKKEENRIEIKLASDFDFTTGQKPEAPKKNKAPRPGSFQPAGGRREHKAPGMPDLSMLKKRDDSSARNFDDDYCPPSDPDEISHDIQVSKSAVKLIGAFLAILLIVVTGLVIYRNKSNDAADNGQEYTATYVSGENLKVNLSASEWATLSAGSAVKPNSLIMTSDSPDNVLTLPNDATLRADSNTYFKLESISSGKDGKVTVTADLSKGRLFAVDSPNTNIVINTKYCRISPVGTKYCVTQEEHANLTEETVVFVFDGSVKVAHKTDSAASMLVNANYKTVVKETSIQKPSLIGKHKSNWLSWNLAWRTLNEMQGAAKRNKVDKKAKKSNPNVQTYNSAGDVNMRANAPDNFTRSHSGKQSGSSASQAASPSQPQNTVADPYHDHVVMPSAKDTRPNNRPAAPPRPAPAQQYSNKQPPAYNPGNINNQGMPNAPGAMDNSQFNPVVNNYDVYNNQPNNYGNPPNQPYYDNNQNYPPPGDNRGPNNPPPPNNNQPPNPPPPDQMHFDPNTGMVSPAYNPNEATPLNDKDLLHSVTDEKNNDNLLKAKTSKENVLNASHYK